MRVRPSHDPQARVCAFATSNSTIKLDSKVIGTSQAAIAGRGDEVPKSFSFDYVASPHVSQETFFEKVGRPMAEYCLSGYNGCIFAYGQTGSGKTYTIQGPDGPHRSEDKGLTVRILEYIFRKLSRAQRASPNYHYVCECSYLELYQEQLQDLLADETKKLDLREDLKKGVYVENMTKIPIRSAEDAEGLFLCGAKKRHVAFSKANDQSSRSHAIFTIYIQIQELNDTGMTAIKSSMLHIVDLAGSERQKNTEASGTRLQEAGTINKSLTHLGKTIRALIDKSENQKVHVPYRESKLTFLLKQSLGGNSKTSIIATVDPGLKSYGETLSTLRFADRAKMIRNNAVINESSAGTLAQLQTEIKRLQLENQSLRQSQSASSSSNGSAGANGSVSPRGLAYGSTGTGSHGGSPIEIERDERICELEELFRTMVERLQKANVERDNFSLKVLDLKKLLLAKESFAESFKLISKLREEKIAQILRCHDTDSASAILVSEEEVDRLKSEIEALKYQRDHHPDVLRVTIENLELKEVLEQYEDHYGPDGEIQQLRAMCAKFSNQIVKLSTDKAKLISLLKGDDAETTQSEANDESTAEKPTTPNAASSNHKLDAWSQEVKVERLEAEIERIKMEAMQQLSAGDEREVAVRNDLEETKQQLLQLEERMARIIESHEEEKQQLEAHYASLSETVRDKYEREIKALYDKLEHAHVSSTTVLTMEKQLSEQTDEYVLMKKIHFDMQSDLKALYRVVEASYKSSELDDEYDDENMSRNARSGQDTDDLIRFEDFNPESPSTPRSSLATPRKSILSMPSKTPSKSPWTPNRGSTMLTPTSRSGLTPGRTSLSIPRLAISKIQELHAVVADFTSKISELENSLAEVDGVHFAACKEYEDRITRGEDKIAELEAQAADLIAREAAMAETVESLESQLDCNNTLVEEKETEATELKNTVARLEQEAARLLSEKEALQAHSSALVTQLKQQKDEQVLAMMKRQDEVETELFEAKSQSERDGALCKDLQDQLSDALERLSTTDATLEQTRALVDSLTSNCFERDEKVKNYKRELADANADRESLLSRLEVLEGAEETLQSLRRENEELVCAAKESCRSLREAQNELSRTEEAHHKEQLELEQEKQLAAHAFEQLQCENDEIAAQLNRAHAQLKKLSSDFSFSQSEASTLKATLIRDQALLTDAKAQIGQMEQLLRAEYVKVAKLEDEVGSLSHSQRKLVDELAESQRLRTSTQSELDECIASLKQKSDQLQTIVNDGTVEEHLLRDERDALQAQLAESRAEVAAISAKLESAASEIFSLQEQFADRETELETKVQERESKLQSLNHSAEVTRRQFQEADGKNIHEIGQLKRQLKEAALEYQSKEKKLQEEIATLQVDKVVALKNAEIAALKSQLESTQHELASMRECLDSAVATAEERDSALTSAKMEFADLSSQKNGKIKYVNKMKLENIQLHREVSELTAKLAELGAAHVTPQAPVPTKATSSVRVPTTTSSTIHSTTPSSSGVVVGTRATTRRAPSAELTDLTNGKIPKRTATVHEDTKPAASVLTRGVSARRTVAARSGSDHA